MKKKHISQVIMYAELGLISLIVLFPILLIVLTSFNVGDSIAGTSLIPKELTLDNYVGLFRETDFIHWFFNTLKIAVLNAIVSVAVILINSWILSRFQFRGKKAYLMSLLLLSMFPTFLSMTAIYVLFLNFGLIGKPVSLIIIYVAGAIPYNTWLVKGYMDGIPRELDEAAYIDGCGRFQSFFKVVLPMSKPIITYCAVSQFMMPWMDYILPNILLSKAESKTLAVGLYDMIARTEEAKFTVFSAGSVIVGIVISALFIVFQNFIVTGISSGANKG